MRNGPLVLAVLKNLLASVGFLGHCGPVSMAGRSARCLLTGPYILYRCTKVENGNANAMTRNPNMREAILSAAEPLFSTRGFNAVSIRDIALEAGANPGSITYHFKSKDGLLLEIYKCHCGPMNKRRIELLVAARRACATFRTGWRRSCGPMCSPRFHPAATFSNT